MHVRRRVPFLNIVPLDAMLAKLRVANAQLIFAHVMHFVAPIAVGRSAANDEAHPVDDTIMQRDVNVNQSQLKSTWPVQRANDRGLWRRSALIGGRSQWIYRNESEERHYRFAAENRPPMANDLPHQDCVSHRCDNGF